MQRLWATTLIFALATISQSYAQTMSFEQAAVVLLNSCGKDIDRHCRGVNIGSGRMRNCLLQTPGVSAACKTDWARVASEVEKRSVARMTVLKFCQADAARLCGQVQKGDGQILECMVMAQKAVSAKCNLAITNAGYR